MCSVKEQFQEQLHVVARERNLEISKFLRPFVRSNFFYKVKSSFVTRQKWRKGNPLPADGTEITPACVFLKRYLFLRQSTIIYAQEFGKAVHSLNAFRIGNLKFKRRPEIYSVSLNMTRNISARRRNRFRCINLYHHHFPK